MDVSFERLAAKEEWLTPPEIINALGSFDLDPCSPINRPWPTAARHYTVLDDGLAASWEGRVFCNPPYGKKTAVWLKKCADHGNAIALTFARTETKMFFESVWSCAHAVLFIQGRLRFYDVKGRRGGTAGAPSVLIAYDKANALALKKSGINGQFIQLK